MNIQWFPGHMTKARKLIEEYHTKVDVFLELLDARLPLSSRNPLLTQLIGQKPRIILLNKTDLTSKNGEWVTIEADNKSSLYLEAVVLELLYRSY